MEHSTIVNHHCQSKRKKKQSKKKQKNPTKQTNNKQRNKQKEQNDAEKNKIKDAYWPIATKTTTSTQFSTKDFLTPHI